MRFFCCHECFIKAGELFPNAMILCSVCGNKRCPKATNHRHDCTGSNEPGQEGSVYGNYEFVEIS